MSDPNTIEPGTIIYNKSPNVQVADDEGNLHRANLVAVAPGEIRFNDPDNSPNVEVADEDGVFHRAQLVAMIGGGGGGSVDKNHVIVKSDTIPAAGADTYNQFYCFDGATNSSYTHGYIYQCIADESTNYIIALTPSQDYSINKLAFDYEFHSPIEIFERIASLSTPVLIQLKLKLAHLD